MGKKNKVEEEEFKLGKKDQKKVTKLASQKEYHFIRGEKEEVVKIQTQIDKIVADAKIAIAAGAD